MGTPTGTTAGKQLEYVVRSGKYPRLKTLPPPNTSHGSSAEAEEVDRPAVNAATRSYSSDRWEDYTVLKQINGDLDTRSYRRIGPYGGGVEEKESEGQTPAKPTDKRREPDHQRFERVTSTLSDNLQASKQNSQPVGPTNSSHSVESATDQLKPSSAINSDVSERYHSARSSSRNSGNDNTYHGVRSGSPKASMSNSNNPETVKVPSQHQGSRRSERYYDSLEVDSMPNDIEHPNVSLASEVKKSDRLINDTSQTSPSNSKQESLLTASKFVFYLKFDDGRLVGPFLFEESKSDVQTREDSTQGMRNRAFNSTNPNDYSSRSHSMLNVMIDSHEKEADDEDVCITKHGKLTYVDLAGSEKVKENELPSSDQLLESNSINRSLLVLGNCISALGDPKKRTGHIPYRDSKLTKLLADSLGGTGVTLMVACISPEVSNATETMNTLRYANRAKKIQNQPIIKLDPKEQMIKDMKAEMNRLRKQNMTLVEQIGKVEADAVQSTRFRKSNTNMTGDKSSRDQEVQMTRRAENRSPEHAHFISSTPKSAAADEALYAMVQEYMLENENLRKENSEYNKARNTFQQEQETLARENDELNKKLEAMKRDLLESQASIHKQQQQLKSYEERSFSASGASDVNGPAAAAPPQVSQFHSAAAGPMPLPPQQPAFQPAVYPPAQSNTAPQGHNPDDDNRSYQSTNSYNNPRRSFSRRNGGSDHGATELPTKPPHHLPPQPMLPGSPRQPAQQAAAYYSPVAGTAATNAAYDYAPPRQPQPHQATAYQPPPAAYQPPPAAYQAPPAAYQPPPHGGGGGGGQLPPGNMLNGSQRAAAAYRDDSVAADARQYFQPPPQPQPPAAQTTLPAAPVVNREQHRPERFNLNVLSSRQVPPKSYSRASHQPLTLLHSKHANSGNIGKINDTLRQELQQLDHQILQHQKANALNEQISHLSRHN